MKTVILTILVFGVIIMLHESGHFLFAKLFHVKVEEFSFGMGPKLWSRIKRDTQYTIRAFPIGGYVAMEGEDSESDDERAFNNKPAWARALVIAAGPVMNFILAVVVLGVMITYMGTSLSPVLADVTQGMPAYEAGIRKGDRIVSVNGENVSDGTETR